MIIAWIEVSLGVAYLIYRILVEWSVMQKRR